MGSTQELHQQTLSMITEWKGFITFLDGFSLDKEIDDEALSLKEKTETFEKLFTATDDGVNEDIYELTVEDEVANSQANENDAMEGNETYEIEDFDEKKTKNMSVKEKPPKKSEVDDESQSSGGSIKDITELIPMKTWAIASEKECPISGRLTKRTGGFFKPTSRVFAAIHSGIFYYFEKQSSKKQKGAFHIANYTCSKFVSDKPKKPNPKEFVFQMTKPDGKHYYFSTQTEEPMLKWVDMFNKLAKIAKEETHKVENAPIQQEAAGSEVVTSDDLYELEPNTNNGELIEEDLIDEDIYTDALDVGKDDQIQDVSTPSPELPRRQINAVGKPPSPPPARQADPGTGPATLRDKPAPPPDRTEPPPDRTEPPPDRPESDIYDNGESALPGPPKSWIEDEQETYTDAISVAPIKQEEKKTENKTIPTKYDTYFYGLWDCTGTTEHELEFHHGDMIEVIERRYDNEGWWVGHLKGKVGLVPKHYLMPAYRKV